MQEKKLIYTDQSKIEFRNTLQANDNCNWKPKGLWYSFGTQWIDWVKYNMPEWLDEYQYVHEIKLNRDKVLVLGEDMSYPDFEKKYGDYKLSVSKYADGSPVPSGIKWLRVMLDLRKMDKHGIEVDSPYGQVGSWLRTWDISSGCIWNEKAIQSIELVETLEKCPSYN